MNVDVNALDALVQAIDVFEVIVKNFLTIFAALNSKNMCISVISSVLLFTISRQIGKQK